MIIKNILSTKSYINRIAIRYGKTTITYSQLHCMVEKYSFKLKHTGFLHGNNIGIFLPNSIQYAISYFTITYLDKVIVPISNQAREAEIKSTIEYCELNLIITNTQNADTLKNLLKDFTYKIALFNLDKENYEIINPDKNYVTMSENIGGNNEDSVAIMLHTSGTTSNPKRVMLTHKNLISNIKSNIESLKFNSNDKVLIALPMFFGYCNTAQFLTHLYLGATIVILESMFMPKSFFNIVSKEHITNFTGVPTMLLMLLNYTEKSKYDISSLRYICFGGGNMPVEKLKELINAFPSVGFVQTYGQTEASPRVTALLPDKSSEKVGSVGKPIPNVKLRIVDESDNDVNVKQTGEIIVQGNNVMKGYYKRAEETVKVIKNGWLYTGDLAYFDEDGYIYLVGRKKNIIISGGQNIYPEEIEEMLMCHPDVKEVCVLGEPHDMLGEVPVAKIVLKDNCFANTDEILKYCYERIDINKTPKRLDIVNELPKTATGKIRRY
jgi:long-chain acyl-CoA synthetase